MYFCNGKAVFSSISRNFSQDYLFIFGVNVEVCDVEDDFTVTSDCFNASLRNNK